MKQIAQREMISVKTPKDIPQGLKPNHFWGASCGTTEVVPCYKALVD
jgi:hypothetical protein